MEYFLYSQITFVLVSLRHNPSIISQYVYNKQSTGVNK